MRNHLGTAALGVATALIVWALTEWLNLLPLPWSVASGIVAGVLVAGVAFLILRRRDPASHRVASGIRAGGSVRIEDVTSTTRGSATESSEVASDVRSKADVDISKVRDERS